LGEPQSYHEAATLGAVESAFRRPGSARSLPLSGTGLHRISPIHLRKDAAPRFPEFSQVSKKGAERFGVQPDLAGRSTVAGADTGSTLVIIGTKVLIANDGDSPTYRYSMKQNLVFNPISNPALKL
jgi:hypothetical protein